jgi:prophage regulatory protein
MSTNLKINFLGEKIMTEETRLIRRPEVERLTGMSRSTIYAKIQDGTFVKPAKLSKRAVAWDYQAVMEWVKERINESKEGGTKNNSK